MKAAIEQYLEDNAEKTSPSEPSCGWHTPNLAPNCCPQQSRRGTLVVTIVQAWDLYGDFWGTTDGYAEMWYGSIHRKTEMINSDDPRWNARYDLGKVDTSLKLKVEVWDEDWQHPDLLGSCERSLQQGTHTITCSAYSGRFEVRYTLTCDPYLTGEKCHLYKPSLSNLV
ncbi:perforin-1-like protein [Lates japonicus]|uniref:Perforin-1-like protein n=1 Tax=Lates japonicus TaxID=270547 RepID=A0AAD3MDX6_LATJO|nr:perforin-1-like protein [Lates japonicus]